jgi:RimJ/RimL family protein N-acetyltransferase
MAEVRFFSKRHLGSESILLRPLAHSEFDLIAQACNDEEIQKWLPLPSPYAVSHADFFVNTLATGVRTSGRGIVFAIDKNGDFVGCIDVKRAECLNGTCEIGYWSVPEFRGLGYVSMALTLLSRWLLLEQEFERVEVRVAVENLASRRVAIKSGFTQEGVARAAGRVHAGRVDLLIYSKVRSDVIR